ncbi:unnamed protein product [Eruca vesicaria subsp. sativa]|uniref:Uncharacterized protein n=1 Tax=Eruca vesicaria subsp. sativa TaxID=29727 RepID=A0ABC8IZF8_ERUVS|nr:unnamed protein product [Eruca vesicaria subsp. sativa]
MDEPSASESTPLLAGSSLVHIDPPPVGSSSLLHTSLSFSQQSFRESEGSSSHFASARLKNVRPKIRADTMD